MIAVSRIRALPHYRHDAFDAGLKRLGYQLRAQATPESKRDLLLIWNRYAHFETEADSWEAHGGTVLVAENGYFGSDSEGRQLYAVSVSQHHHGMHANESSSKFDLAPYRKGEHILICAQRGIGSRLMASPPNWHTAIANKLRKQTDRPIRIRMHPGRHAPTVPLEDDLRDAHCAVVWSSNAGVKALSLGVPVYFTAPRWICEGAALRPDGVESPCVDEGRRDEAFRRMAQMQFTVEQITSGEPFTRIQ